MPNKSLIPLTIASNTCLIAAGILVIASIIPSIKPWRIFLPHSRISGKCSINPSICPNMPLRYFVL